jgi:hypothetical protein
VVCVAGELLRQQFRRMLARYEGLRIVHHELSKVMGTRSCYHRHSWQH